MKIISVVLVFLMGSVSWSASFNYKYESFGRAKTNIFYGYGEKKDWRWGFSLARTLVKFDQVSGGAVNTLSDTQNFIEGGATYTLPETGWRFGLNYNYARSPEENLTSKGPTVSARYHFDDWSLDAAISSFGMTQEFSTPTRTSFVSKPISGTNDIRQNIFHLGADWRADEILNLYLGWNKYHYSRNVTEFTRYLDFYDSNNALLYGLQNQLSSFNDNTLNLKAKTFIEDWDIVYSLMRAVSATNNAETLSHTIELSHTLFDIIRANAGFGLSSTEGKGTVAGRSANYFFFSLGTAF